MTSFSIRCNEGFNGGLPQSFLLQVRESQSQDLRANITSPVARFAVTGLEAGAHYQAGFYSFNAKGRSEPVVMQAATLRLPEKQLTAEKDHPRMGFKFTPMMSVLIGVASALLIVALVVLVVLRFQCTNGDGHRKRHKTNASSVGSLERRGSVSGPASSDKAGGSPVSKHESSAGECDSDEKNPDIIPQPVDSDEQNDFIRKRQLISTIETSSPSRGLLHHQPGNSGAGYIGYCTLRNGMPLHEMTAQSKMHVGGGSLMPQFPAVSCTLPRQPWQQYGGPPVSHLQPVIYPTMQYRSSPQQAPIPTQRQRPQPPPRDQSIQLQPLTNSSPLLDDEPTVETPLMVTKRESTV